MKQQPIIILWEFIVSAVSAELDHLMFAFFGLKCDKCKKFNHSIILFKRFSPLYDKVGLPQPTGISELDNKSDVKPFGRFIMRDLNFREKFKYMMSFQMPKKGFPGPFSYLKIYVLAYFVNLMILLGNKIMAQKKRRKLASVHSISSITPVKERTLM